MTKSKADKKKQMIRIGALVIAGVMALSVLLAVILQQ